MGQVKVVGVLTNPFVPVGQSGTVDFEDGAVQRYLSNGVLRAFDDRSPDERLQPPYGGYKKDELVGELDARGLPSDGKVEDLVARLEQADNPG